MSSLRKRNIGEGLESLEQGSHICCIYDNKEEQLSMLTTFIEIGLDRNEKFLYIFDDRTKEELIKRFKASNIDIEELMETGQFDFLTKRESYLENGYFEPEKMFKLFLNAKEEALAEGYNGLRATGEMTWIFTEVPGVERLMEYESKLNNFIQGEEMTILCQYNENKFSPENLLDVIHTHPKVIIHDFLYENHYYMPVEVFAKRLNKDVDKDYYEKIKQDLEEKAKLTGRPRKSSKEDEDTVELLETLEELEKASL